MKKVVISTVVFVFSLILLLYLYQSISPWNTDLINDYIEKFSIDTGREFEEFIDDSIKAGIIFDYLDIKNVLILHIFTFLTITSFISTIHMFVDKLFFKKFFEEPDVSVAIRRSIWVSIILFMFNFIRVFGVLSIFYIVIVLIVIIIIILVELSFAKKNTIVEKEVEGVKTKIDPVSDQNIENEEFDENEESEE